MATDSYPQSHGSLAGLSGTDHHPQYGLPISGPATSRPTAPYRFGRWYYATDTAAMSFDQGAGWLDMASKAYVDTQVAGFSTVDPPKTVRIPHTFTIAGPVGLPSGDTNYIPQFFVPVPSGQSVSIVAAHTKINSGTSVTWKLYNYSTPADVAGFTGLVAQTTPLLTTPTAVPITINGTQIGPVITAISGAPQNMTITLYVTYTV